VNLPADAAEALRTLAAGESGQLPYDFAEFQRRQSLRRQQLTQSRLRPARMTAAAATLSAVLLGAAMWHYLGVPGGAEPPGTAAIPPAAEAPALVRAGPLARRSELEARIAMIDAMLSESRVSGVQADSLRAMELGRSTLVSSLQRVTYAQQLVEPWSPGVEE
jgi:hypothetical protein